MSEQIANVGYCRSIVQAHVVEHNCHLVCLKDLKACPFVIPAVLRELRKRGLTEAFTTQGETFYPMMYSQGKIESMTPVKLINTWTWEYVVYAGIAQPKMRILVQLVVQVYI